MFENYLFAGSVLKLDRCTLFPGASFVARLAPHVCMPLMKLAFHPANAKPTPRARIVRQIFLADLWPLQSDSKRQSLRLATGFRFEHIHCLSLRLFRQGFVIESGQFSLLELVPPVHGLKLGKLAVGKLLLLLLPLPGDDAVDFTGPSCAIP